MRQFLLIIAILLFITPVLAEEHQAENKTETTSVDMEVGFLKKISNSTPPELYYDDISDSLAEEFIRHYNKSDAKAVYDESHKFMKNEFSYQAFEEVFKNFRFVFGGISNFRRITRQEQLADILIMELSAREKKLPSGELCDFYLYKVDCEYLLDEGILDLIYVDNKLISVHIRAKPTDFMRKIESVEKVD